jgi:uncharacterized damage-inducible protein DinB
VIDSEYCQVMARYGAWMNSKLFALCAGLSDDARKQDRGAFFRSIHGTLNHGLSGDLAWLSRFTGDPESPPPSASSCSRTSTSSTWSGSNAMPDCRRGQHGLIAAGWSRR